MTVRRKTLLITTLVIGGLIAILYLSARLIVLDSFSRLERENMSKNVARARQAILEDLKQVDTLCADWAPWDDTYAFVQDGNQKYIAGNLTDSTIANLRLNLTAFADSSGKLVYLSGFDLEAGAKTSPPRDILPYLAPGGALLTHASLDSSHVGILQLPEGLMLVSARPILTSEEKGPIRGTLVFGRFLDLKRVSEITRLSLSAHTLGQRQLPPDVRRAVTAVTSGSAGFWCHPVGKTVFGYAVLPDLFGRPGLLLEVKLPRAIYREGQATLRYLLISLVALGAISLLVVCLLMDKAVLRRLARLSAGLRKISEARQPGARVSLPGKDEISALANTINEMLSALEQAEQTVRYQAHHDALTDLPNRFSFYERLSRAVVDARRHGHMMAVLMLDVDGLKTVNDSLGHLTGDELLKQVARRLRGCLREEDAVGRVGGDEFAVLLPRIKQPGNAATVAEKVLGVLRLPLQIAGDELPTCASIGISLYPKDGQDVQTLLQTADIALYRAKDEGKNTFRFYAAHMNARSLARLVTANSLREALPCRQLWVYYQPQVSLQSGNILAAEALLRWQHPDLGLLYPGQFLALAEETGLIVPIGEWVLRQACSQSKRWAEAGHGPVPVAVNLSGSQLHHPALLDMLAEVLSDTGLGPHLLSLEIPETSVLPDLESSARLMRRMKQLGVRLCLEDLTTLEGLHVYLARLPLDAVKIDRFCLRSLAADSVIAEALALGLEVIAEGAETEGQLALFRQHGCQVAQGYVVARPVPPGEFEGLLLRGLPQPLFPVAEAGVV